MKVAYGQSGVGF